MRVVTEPRQKGESASDAIGVLYRCHRERLWRALVAFTADRDVASDATAEAFAQLLRRGAVVRDPASWVWRAAFRIAAGELKARRARGLPLPPATPVASHVNLESFELVEALQRIPLSQRQVLILRYYAGYSAKEIAAMLDSTHAAVRMRLSRARLALRRLLEEADA